MIGMPRHAIYDILIKAGIDLDKKVYYKNIIKVD